jgi:hypothetical protein
MNRFTYRIEFDPAHFPNSGAPMSGDAVGNVLYQLGEDVRLALLALGDSSAVPTVAGERDPSQSSWMLSVTTSIDKDQVDAIVDKALKDVHMLGHRGEL